MALPHLDIAKVSFSALLLRPDPVSQSRAEIDDFLRLLDAASARCSFTNVQKCKQWIVANIAQSPARTAALLKYATALSKSYTAPLLQTRQNHEPSARRKRLHLLYVLNDAFYHTRVRNHDKTFATNAENGLSDLLKLAASYTDCPRHIKKVNDLLELWGNEAYFASATLEKFRGIVRDAPAGAASQAPTKEDGATATKSAKDVPYIMPAVHGDATAPWYDLPAANWLPVIEPNSTRPMNPDMIKPLQFKSAPAEPQLIDAVKALLADASRLYSKEHTIGEDDGMEIDQMGQPVVRDEATGEITNGQTYYGWSRAFCEKMKQRRAKTGKTGSKEDERGRSLSRSLSRSVSRSLSGSRSRSSRAYKRRRTSDSRSPSQSRSRNRSSPRRRPRRDSGSRSPSRSRDRRESRSRSRSRSRSPPRGPARHWRESHAGNSSGNHIPSGPSAMSKAPYQQQNLQPPPIPPPPFPMGTDFSNFPGLPPRPPNYQGPWPPPIPPPLPGGGFPYSGWSAPPNMPGFPGMPMGGWGGNVPSPPPPPPPPPQQEQFSSQQYDGNAYQQYGRGGHGNPRGGQRGGWSRGRGGW